MDAIESVGASAQTEAIASVGASGRSVQQVEDAADKAIASMTFGTARLPAFFSFSISFSAAGDAGSSWANNCVIN